MHDLNGWNYPPSLPRVHHADSITEHILLHMQTGWNSGLVHAASDATTILATCNQSWIKHDQTTPTLRCELPITNEASIGSQTRATDNPHEVQCRIKGNTARNRIKSTSSCRENSLSASRHTNHHKSQTQPTLAGWRRAAIINWKEDLKKTDGEASQDVSKQPVGGLFWFGCVKMTSHNKKQTLMASIQRWVKASQKHQKHTDSYW